MKTYEVWEGDHYLFVSDHDTFDEARQERDRLNREHNRDYYLRKNTPDGKLNEISRRRGEDVNP